MNIALWILQVLLAAMFLWHGWLFVNPPAQMVQALDSFLNPGFRVFIGVAELLAVVGLILPGLTRTAPALLPLAALGLMIVTGSACVLHLTRGETSSALTTAVLFVVLAFVAYGRWRLRPITPRSSALTR